jgi:UDP-2,4-diacetamido-2,4,6-trideoxy-beta-L-altropyranose hydrolase
LPAGVNIASDLRIAYCCDGGGRVGWGHISRGRALVDRAGPGSELLVGACYDEVRASFSRADISTRLRRWGRDSAHPDIPSEAFDILVVDHYGIGSDWIIAASQAMPTYIVDDWMRERVQATGLINPNIGASLSDYVAVQVSDSFMGSQYALLRDEVRRMPRGDELRMRVSMVLVTMGGADPFGITRQVVECLAETEWFVTGGRIFAAIGQSYRGPDPAASLRAMRPNQVEVLRQPADFLSLCRESDLVVCSASTTSHEMAYLGRPFVPIAFADNQVGVVRGWAQVGIGAALDTRTPNWKREFASDAARLLGSRTARNDLAVGAMARVDGKGAERLLDALRLHCTC